MREESGERTERETEREGGEGEGGGMRTRPLAQKGKN